MSNSKPHWATFTDGEEKVWKGHPSILRFIGGILTGILLIAIAVGFWLIGVGIVDSPLPRSLSLPLELPVHLIAAGIVLLGAFLIVASLIQWKATVFLITTEEVYLKKGIVSRDVVNTGIDRIYNTDYSQGPVERVLSVGTVNIQTAGTSGTDLVFRHVPHPSERVETIVRLRDG